MGIPQLIRFDERDYGHRGGLFYWYKALIVQPDGTIAERAYNSTADEKAALEEFPGLQVIPERLEGEHPHPSWDAAFEQAYPNIVEAFVRKWPASRERNHA